MSTTSTAAEEEKKEAQKLKRNERDRRLSQLKRDKMKQMRQQVKALEQQKAKLLSDASSVNNQTDEDSASGSPVAHNLSTQTLLFDEDLQERKRQFVALTDELESLRKENADLTHQLRQVDRFYGSIQAFLFEFNPELAQTQPEDEDDDIYAPQLTTAEKRQQVYANFTPLDPEQITVFANQAIHSVINARLRHERNYECDSSYQQVHVFGFNVSKRRDGAAFTFSIKKHLPMAPYESTAFCMWQVLMNHSLMTRLLPPLLSCEFRVLQQLGDNLWIIDRRTVDKQRQRLGDTKYAIRTIYLLSRVEFESSDKVLFIMKTLDFLNGGNVTLEPEELWAHNFYWYWVERSDDPRGGSNVEFGGSVRYVADREDIAISWMAELVCIAVRWESTFVSPILLQQ